MRSPLRFLPTALAALGLLALPGHAAPAPDRVFHLLPIWDDLTGLTDDKAMQEEMDKLKAQIGVSSKKFRVGFSFITGPNTERLTHIADIARQNDLYLGLIFGSATHSQKGSAVAQMVQNDFRLAQWRLDGKTWKGAFKKNANTGVLETAEGPRDFMVPTPSRYAENIQADYERLAKAWGSAVSALIKKRKDAVGAVSFSIEEELAVGGGSSDDFLADYSPFAVTEFRDWLRHRGLYDVNGKFAGQGAPAAITGPFTNVGGKAVSPFYDDPTPADSRGGGSSFNTRFGTKFTTWDLAYWDLKKFPGAIKNENFECSPAAGLGATPGGFDAPRKRGDSAYWRAWSWDYGDQGKKYPPGYPKAPAYGFRQTMVRNFLLMIYDVLLKEGIPVELLYPHQIPGELWNVERDRSSASTLWSATMPNGNLGITYFGHIDTKKIEPYSQSWGAFEWHPKSRLDPQSDELKKITMEHIEEYYNAKSSVMFPGWWRRGRIDPIFPLNDSKFAEGLKEWLAKKQREEGGRPAGPVPAASPGGLRPPSSSFGR